ncbi:hypothetical protein BUALT_Bualt13G0071700 [Buddleja alternifolia]|uniref:Zinc finger PMZ-type domain-containing protein n=1 Tax=Buddleja alternifolia TaxID=168488 RepID=A0AAV6WL61_9LAMI|nr:hypothetical protein BUALT_Bualt13G0071700 [Buddleja alternifolia]
MQENFKKKYKTNLLKDLFWRAASSANKPDFEMCKKRVELADPKIDENVKIAAEWLREVPFQHWCMDYFRTSCKSDILVNNLCQSFNNYILKARDKPIISMIEWIRTRLMSRIQMKKEGMFKYVGVVCPNILKKINKQSEVARNCTTRFRGGMEFEVDHLLDKYVVDLDRKTCTCGMYQLNRYPCCYAYATIANKRNDVEDYVDVCYKKKTYLKGPVADQVPEAPQQTKNATTQQIDGFDAPKPTQASQSAPIAAGSSGGISAAPAGSGGISAATAGSEFGSGSGSEGTIAATNTPGNKPAPKKKTKRTSISDVLKNIRTRDLKRGQESRMFVVVGFVV